MILPCKGRWREAPEGCQPLPPVREKGCALSAPLTPLAPLRGAFPFQGSISVVRAQYAPHPATGLALTPRPR